MADFDRLVAVNARGPFLMMAAVADRLADGGRIVNISSGVTSTALAGIGLYSGVKAFLDQVTRVAAVEFAARGITVNAVAPGSTATGPFAGLTADQKVAAASSFGIGRIGNRRIPQPWSPSSPPPRPGSSPGRSSTSSAGSTARSAGQRRRADAAGRLICCATGARRDMTLAWE